MNTLENKIKAFANDPETQIAALALMKVGNGKGDDPMRIMARVIAFILLTYHEIPLNPTGNKN
jgi:hypothetical protein